MTALFESFSLTIILNVFSLSIPTLLHFSQVGKPVLDTVYPLPPDPSSTPLDTTQAMSHEQPVGLTTGSNHPRSAFIEEVNDEDIPVPSSSPQLIGHAT